jgi:hypothetical protein
MTEVPCLRLLHHYAGWGQKQHPCAQIKPGGLQSAGVLQRSPVAKYESSRQCSFVSGGGTAHTPSKHAVPAPQQTVPLQHEAGLQHTPLQSISLNPQHKLRMAFAQAATLMNPGGGLSGSQQAVPQTLSGSRHFLPKVRLVIGWSSIGTGRFGGPRARATGGFQKRRGPRRMEARYETEEETIARCVTPWIGLPANALVMMRN